MRDLFAARFACCWDTTWFAYALEAESTWGDAPKKLDDVIKPFAERFAAGFYGTRDVEAGKLIASTYFDLDAAKSDIERNNYLIRDIIGVFDVQDVCYLDNNTRSVAQTDRRSGVQIPKGDGKSDVLARDIVRKRCEHGIEVAKTHRQQLKTALAGRVDNVASADCLVTAARKIENHCERTIFLLDYAEAQRDGKLSNESAEKLRPVCDNLMNETQLLLDEMNLLTCMVRWLERRCGWTAPATQKVLASLQSFKDSGEISKWLSC